MKSGFFSAILAASIAASVMAADAQTNQPPPAISDAPIVSASPSSNNSPAKTSGKRSISPPAGKTNAFPAELAYAEPRTNRASESSSIRVVPVENSGLIGAIVKPKSQSFLSLIDITAPLPRSERAKRDQAWTSRVNGRHLPSPSVDSSNWGDFEGIALVGYSW